MLLGREEDDEDLEESTKGVTSLAEVLKKDLQERKGSVVSSKP